MKLGSTTALGTAAVPVVLNGGTLDLATDGTVANYNITVGGNAAIASDKATAASAGITHTLGNLSIGAFQLDVAAGSNVASGTAGLTFGNVTFTGRPHVQSRSSNPAHSGKCCERANTATFTGSGNFTQTAATVWGGGAGGLTLGTAYTGTATLSQANTYTGVTTVNGGTLKLSAAGNAFAGNLVIGDGSGTDTVQLLASNQIPDAAVVTLNTGGVLALGTFNETIGTLQGNGSVTATTGNLTVTTSLSPGFSPGLINTGNLTLTSGTTYAVELNGAAAGTGYDQTNVTGGVLWEMPRSASRSARLRPREKSSGSSTTTATTPSTAPSPACPTVQCYL